VTTDGRSAAFFITGQKLPFESREKKSYVKVSFCPTLTNIRKNIALQISRFPECVRVARCGSVLRIGKIMLTGKIGILGEKSVPVARCQPQTSHISAFGRNHAAVVTHWQLMASDMT
jgi:hypothetical protein